MSLSSFTNEEKILARLEQEKRQLRAELDQIEAEYIIDCWDTAEEYI